MNPKITEIGLSGRGGMKDLALFSIELIRNIILLCAGAILTGIAVPTVNAVIAWRSARRQKFLDSELARQKELIDSQIKFLCQFSDLAWKMVFEIFKVSYAFAYEAQPLRGKVYGDYGPISWDFLSKIRGTIGGGIRLMSRETWLELIKLYEWLIGLDGELCTMADAGEPQKAWEEFHEKKFDEAGDQIDFAISKLAIDFRLSSENMSRGPKKRLTLGEKFREFFKNRVPKS